MSNYPLRNFHFTVEWGGTKISFTEVSGLDIYFEPILYRDGASPEYTDKKMPGIVKYNNITLKRGLMAGDSEFFEWLNRNSLFNSVERRDIVIKLLDEEHKPVFTWVAKNAFPVRYSGPALNARSNEVAMEELELAHEGLKVLE
jgi:phage tail-like protein